MGHFIPIQRDSILLIVIWAFIGCSIAFTGCDTPAAINTGQEQVHVAAAKADSGIITTETGLKIRVTILPGLDSTASSEPLSMNNLGQIVGRSHHVGENDFRAVMWENGTIKDISQGRDMIPYSINDHGIIVGALRKGPRSSERHAFKLENGEITDLCNIVGTFSGAVGINNKNQIVGTANIGSFFYDQGKVTYFRHVVPDASSAFQATGGINEKGHFTGYIDKVDSSIEQDSDLPTKVDIVPLLWKDGEFIELGWLGGGPGNEFPDVGQALSINDHDQVVGFAQLNPNDWSAFLWEDGAMTDLGFLDENPVNSDNRSSANSINNKGQIVGISDSFTNGSQRRHAFLWENGKMIDIGTEEILGIQTSSEAVSINEQGQIVGTFVDYSRRYSSSPQIRAVLWEIIE